MLIMPPPGKPAKQTLLAPLKRSSQEETDGDCKKKKCEFRKAWLHQTVETKTPDSKGRVGLCQEKHKVF